LCTGRPDDPSPVLAAIGHPGVSGFRLSLGPSSTEADIDALLGELPTVVEELRDVERASTDALARFRPPQEGG
jgi:cysteine sulfinate desulfinase/cysteine desulfurase-like protein